MYYMNGSEIMLGDKVSLGGGVMGIVVCCFENRDFLAEFAIDGWEDYTRGVMVLSPEAGLIYYPETSIDLILIKRK